MIEQALQSNLVGIIKESGSLGVFVAMFLESSVIPIPSEAIIVGADAIGIPINSIVIFGSLGSTFGGIAGYLLGRYAAIPTILKFGKYILIKPHHIYKAEAIAKKYGVWGVLAGRILPIVPFKIFSIASGITKMPLIPFIICTIVGVVPRIYLLALFGESLIRYTKPTMLILLIFVVIFLAFKITRIAYNGNASKKQ